MTTIVNTPSGSGDNGGGSSFLIGVILIIVVIVLFFVYGLPAIRNAAPKGGTQINVPDQIDVNVNGGGQQ